MAYVPLTAVTLTFKGQSGATYQIPITKATAVGFCTFTQDGQTFWKVPEDVRLVDAYVGDASNAADYVDMYLDSIQKIQMRLPLLGIKNATTVPHVAPSSMIRKGTQIAIYHFSA